MAYLFHAGGAASQSLLDPSSIGIGVMRDVFCRWSELDITQIGSLIAIASTIPTAWRFLQHTSREAYGWIRQCFLASVTIPGGDPLNRSVVKWILANQARHYRSFTGRTKVGSSSDRAAALKKTQHPVQYSSHWHTRWIWFGSNLFIVTRAVESIGASFSDPSYDGIGGEDITISCFGWSAEPVKKFIETCREYSDRQAQFFVIIYARDRYGLAWKPKARKPIRHLETVHFDSVLKQELLNDIRNYLDSRTQLRYQSRSMPYRRGYLFYGPPGTGKSSLSIAIAGEFGLDLYEVKIPSVATDADLEQMFQEIPPRCVVLLEDIDAVWVDRSSADKGTEGNMVPNCTLSGLLNVLDGVGSQEGRIVIMTTNRPEDLDSALVRPGRVDKKVFLGNISQKSAADMFVRMFSPDLGCTSHLDMEEIQELATQFASKIPEDTFTPSLLQGFFQLHLESPENAASNIAAWVKKELVGNSDKDFEVISSKKKL
ncbi:P-loop containing nucleoside triphosphate hydrolase protein [Dactylonectria estremocensis]|uniref:P-loop containing nucleoside triphosphate hydrolase protein n=1 Tax=Dactylonectria estremocensis TaxID=1079267 RepID=A0A9P9EVA5_9HYPO|nr:P-loop containing nucleoside triphosphate hydrolase protein [Dactylonectria estremocensis]